MNQMKINGEELVFGLDIGTRSVVGIVGYRQGERFVVAAQEIRKHQTRAMIDGQIHDINRVAATISDIRQALQDQTGLKLDEVCIAAAGRVLKTMDVHVDMELDKERNVTKEDISTLISMGVEQAVTEFQDKNDTEMRFYCVGYSVMRYFLNGMWMGQPEHHKAKIIGADMIATFLPDDVVDGLYSAVDLAGLKVANLTLEPIAAIRVAIPERFRLLNIAMVDVGAGTSDISITNDGSVVAFGMLPHAGDLLTEILARTCLIDFATAEKIKVAASQQEEIRYEDIMGLEQTITAAEVVSICQPEIDKMTKLTAEKIRELNGGTSPSAVFIVGGGGKIAGFDKSVAQELGLDPKRVALRGEEILGEVEFPEGALKDSTIITPIGICLTYYEQNNNFIYITFNESRIKLYDNNKLTVMDAAMQAAFARDGLFPRRGKQLCYQVNGKNRVTRGEYGESAHVYVNGEEVNLSYNIKANDIITLEESTLGQPAEQRILDLVDYNGKIVLCINGDEMQLPKPVRVNGAAVTAQYQIQEGDSIEILSYYTYEDFFEYMGISREDMALLVNGVEVDKEAQLYSHDQIEIKNRKELQSNESIQETPASESVEDDAKAESAKAESVLDNKAEDTSSDAPVVEEVNIEKEPSSDEAVSKSVQEETITKDLQSATTQAQEESNEAVKERDKKMIVIVNQKPVVMRGKQIYTFVDVFDYIDFDTSKMRGTGIATLVNGKDAQYTQELHNGDKIEIYWKE